MKKRIITVALLIAIPLFLFIMKDSLMKKSFDAKYFSSSSKTMKFRMALDIVDNNKFIGSQIDMARANLGRPDHTAPDSISYAINEPLGWRDTISFSIKNGLISNVYIHD